MHLVREMNDASLLLIKPEIIQNAAAVQEHIRRRTYVQIGYETQRGWRNVAREIYASVLHATRLESFVNAYDMNQFPDTFGLLVLKHPQGGTLQKLKAIQGGFNAYQKQTEDTLRAQFGLRAEHNIEVSSDFTVVFNAVHCPGTLEELKHHVSFFRLEKYF